MPGPNVRLTLGSLPPEDALKIHNRNRQARPHGPRLIANRSIANGASIELRFTQRIVADSSVELDGFEFTADGAALTGTFVEFENGPDEGVLRLTVSPAITNGQKVRVQYDGSGTLRSARDPGSVMAKSGAMPAAETIQNYTT